ncbi:MAG: hypothetical protein EHM72_15905, partial [Calditrichaeota bacterium]
MIKDILYISGTNKDSQANWEHLLQFYPTAHCLNGQATMHVLLQQCREHIHDEFFLLVSSATRLLRPLDGDLPQRLKDQTCYLWQVDNSINRLQWSFAGPVLLPAQVVDHQFNPLLPTLSSKLLEPQRIPQKAFLYLNSDSAQNAWKTGFCEGLSLTCHLKNNDCPEFRMLLDMWCRDNAAQGFSPWANRGARYGREFGSLYVDPELTLLNAVDDAWLENEFHLEERLFPVQPLMCQEPRPDEYASFDTAIYPTSNKSLYVSTLTDQSRLLTQELA